MTLLVIVSGTLDGAQKADSLQGGGNGVDLGQVGTGSWTPVTSKVANQGHLDLYIQHDSPTPVHNCKTFIQPYGTGTAFTYGGGDSAVADYATMKAIGYASGSSKNNADGLSGGLWIDMDAGSGDGTRFDQANFPDMVKIYGDNNTDGLDLPTAFTIVKEAMVYNSGSETVPSAPVDGDIGSSASPLVLGDAAHVKLRQYLPNLFGQSGYLQFEWVIALSEEA